MRMQKNEDTSQGGNKMEIVVSEKLWLACELGGTTDDGKYSYAVGLFKGKEVEYPHSPVVY